MAATCGVVPLTSWQGGYQPNPLQLPQITRLVTRSCLLCKDCRHRQAELFQKPARGIHKSQDVSNQLDLSDNQRKLELSNTSPRLVTEC